MITLIVIISYEVLLRNVCSRGDDLKEAVRFAFTEIKFIGYSFTGLGQ